MSGPFGYRPPSPTDSSLPLHPVTACYMQDGVEGILRALPGHAIEDMRNRLATSNLNVIAGALLFGFVLLIIWDVLIKRR